MVSSDKSPGNLAKSSIYSLDFQAFQAHATLGVSGQKYLQKIGYQFNQLYYLFIQSQGPLNKDFNVKTIKYSRAVILLSIIVGQVTHSQVSWSPPSDRLTRGRLSLVGHNIIQAIERFSLVERRVPASN